MENVLPLLTSSDPSKPSRVAMVLLESPTNPLLQIADLEGISSLVHQHVPEALVVVDNTMMSPYLQRPLEHGADIVYDSATKYLSGHHDLMAGAVVCDREDIAKVCLLLNFVRQLLTYTAHRPCHQFGRQRSSRLRLLPSPSWHQDSRPAIRSAAGDCTPRCRLPRPSRLPRPLPWTTFGARSRGAREAGAGTGSSLEFRDWR